MNDNFLFKFPDIMKDWEIVTDGKGNTFTNEDSVIDTFAKCSLFLN